MANIFHWYWYCNLILNVYNIYWINVWPVSCSGSLSSAWEGSQRSSSLLCTFFITLVCWQIFANKLQIFVHKNIQINDKYLILKKSLLLDKAADVLHHPHLHLVLDHKLVHLVDGVHHNLVHLVGGGPVDGSEILGWEKKDGFNLLLYGWMGWYNCVIR